MATPDLFKPQPRARRNDPRTSHEAAAKFNPNHHHMRIAFALRRAGPRTIHELSALCVGMTPEAIARRMPELQQMQVVRPTGATRASPSGRECRVWEWVEG